jgi:hypothetical protein
LRGWLVAQADKQAKAARAAFGLQLAGTVGGVFHVAFRRADGVANGLGRTPVETAGIIGKEIADLFAQRRGGGRAAAAWETASPLSSASITAAAARKAAAKVVLRMNRTPIMTRTECPHPG